MAIKITFCVIDNFFAPELGKLVHLVLLHWVERQNLRQYMCTLRDKTVLMKIQQYMHLVPRRRFNGHKVHTGSRESNASMARTRPIDAGPQISSPDSHCWIGLLCTLFCVIEHIPRAPYELGCSCPVPRCLSIPVDPNCENVAG